MAVNSPYSIANLLKPSTKSSEEANLPTPSKKALNLAQKLAGKLLSFTLHFSFKHFSDFQILVPILREHLELKIID